MASNKLFEAAAEILAGSKSAAPAMPPEKIPAEVHDAGGPTPQNYKNNDNSAKISPSSKSAAAPTTKPSAASPDKQEMLGKGQSTMREDEEVSDEEEVIAETEEQLEEKKEWKAKMKEDVDSLFADDSTISEEFKEKVSTIFEARVTDRVAQIEEEIETAYAGILEEAVESIRADLTEKVDDYLSYVVEQWMEENQIAIEAGLRSEITEEFISGLRNLFAEHYIDVPAEKVDLVDELASKVEELETSLNEEIERGIQTKKALVEARKAEIIHTVCEGLITTQVEKIKSLAESVEFSTEDEYKTKLETIRENYFPSGAKRADEKQLHEELEGTDDKVVDPMVAAVAQAISKTRI
jgi:hypothetical protein